MTDPSQRFGIGDDLPLFVLDVPTAPMATVKLRARTLTPQPFIVVQIVARTWEALAGRVAQEFNQRLHLRGEACGTFGTGDHYLAPYLGKELALLFFAAEGATAEHLPAIAANWLALPPESRWWLYTTIEATRDHPGYGPDRGWRRAIKIALAETSVVPVVLGRRD